MKKLGIGLAFAAAVLMTTVSSKPAKAGSDVAVALVTLAVTAAVTVLSLRCKDEKMNEYLCAFPPAKQGKFVGMKVGSFPSQSTSTKYAKAPLKKTLATSASYERTAAIH